MRRTKRPDHNPPTSVTEVLVAHLKSRQGMGKEWVVGTEMTLGVGRADVLAVMKSWRHPTIRIYEVKEQRSDFERDWKSGKYT